MRQSDLRELSRSLADKITMSGDDIEYFNSPFSHLVIDNFLPDGRAIDCLKNFPDVGDPCWDYSNDKDIELKGRTKWTSEFDVPEGIIDAVRLFNSAEFLRALSSRFDIQKLLPDPYFSGGGLNIMGSGGLLDVHVDGNYHDASGLNRRLNVILFLNKEWRSSWGGEFSIYDRNGEKCIKKIEPIFNRLVVFETHDFSWHGVPEPLCCPSSVYRRSLILYYYTRDCRPSSLVLTDRPHRALWKKRGGKDKQGNLHRQYY